MKNENLKLDKITGLYLPKEYVEEKQKGENEAREFYYDIKTELYHGKLKDRYNELEKEFKGIKQKKIDKSLPQNIQFNPKIYGLEQVLDQIDSILDNHKKKHSKLDGYVKRVIRALERLKKNVDDEIESLFKECDREFNSNEKKVTVPMIALKYVYEKVTLNREKCQNITKQYGHNSGDYLYNQYIYYSEKTNRRGKPNPFTRKKLENKIGLFESVLEIIDKSKNSLLLDELTILKSYEDSFD